MPRPNPLGITVHKPFYRVIQNLIHWAPKGREGLLNALSVIHPEDFNLLRHTDIQLHPFLLQSQAIFPLNFNHPSTDVLDGKFQRQISDASLRRKKFP